MNARVAWALACTLTAAAAGADETEIVFDGAGIADWSTGRDSARLAKEFSLSELSAASDPAALQWRFVVRDAGFNDKIGRASCRERV